MLISNLFSRKVFSIMISVFAILDIAFIICVGLFFYISLNKNSDNIESVILENNREIQNSFDSFLTRRISQVKKDLFLIGKHSNIFLGKLNMKINPSSEFYQNYNKDLDKSCLIEGSKIEESSIKDTYKDKILDKANPLISYIINYYNTSEKKDSEAMIKYFKNDKIFDKISFYEGVKDENNTKIDNYIGYVCYMKSIFKSIFIAESVTQGIYTSLNSIYLFMNNFVFQYLPNNTNLKSIKRLSLYSDKIICKNQYTSRCISDFIKENLNYSINSNYKEISYAEYFHYFDKNYNFYSCLNLNDFTFNNVYMGNNYICIEHNINNLFQRQFHFQNLTSLNIKNNITDLISVAIKNKKLLIIYSLKYDINEFYNVYNYYFNTFEEILRNFIFTDISEIELFHLIYFDLFKYKNLTGEIISELIKEYEEIKNNIINGIMEIKNSQNSSINEKIIKSEQTFLDSTYNISGMIDYEKGSIEKNNFIYLITPIIDKNIYYKSNIYTKINFTLIDSNYRNNEGNILGYNIIFFQNSLHFWDMKIFKIMALILVRWFIYFIILILFISTVFNVLFTKYLDHIFNPISLLYERLSSKIMSNKMAYNEQNEYKNKINTKKDNNNDKNSLTDINSEITSLTPEMEDLIQLCKFLENITYMKKLMLSNEQMELDFELMNEMYNVLTNKIDMIKYGHFVSSFYFKKKKYNECNNSIKVIETILEEEKNRFKEENENIEIEVINVISNKYYINEFQSSREVFESKNSLSQLNYFELIIIREKLYFYLGICNLYIVKELKNKLKELKKNYELQTKKNYYNTIRGRSFIMRKRFKSKSNFYRSGADNLEQSNFRMPLNTQAKNIKILEEQIIKKSEIASKYFKISLEINTKYCINKIKCIITLLYIAKCQLYKEKKRTEAIDTMKNAIIKLYSLNQDFININEICKFNPIIMLLINGAIMEQILFLIVKINKKINNKLTTELLSDIMKISFFKTDNIQSKTCQNIISLIKLANSNKNNNKKLIKNKIFIEKIGFFKKIYNRLSPKLKIQNQNITKNIFILFSPNLIKALPSYIELSEIISKCIKNYMDPNDKILCLRFDMRLGLENMKTSSELNKEYIIRILLQNSEIVNVDKYGMQNCIFSIVHKIYKNRIINNNIDNSTEDNKEIFLEDNYIFQFILTKDYTFNSIDNNKKFKEELKNNNTSLYTFIFDEDLKINSSKEDGKLKKIINNLKKIPEGVLISVDNFHNIKMAFQNISRIYKPKNIFRVNSDSYNNIYIDYH